MGKKPITHAAKLILSTWNVGWFFFIWIFFYNDYTFDTYKFYGATASLIIYIIIYSVFCNIYKAFRIASTNIGEATFTQIISYGFADVILYVECCLINNHYVNIFPGLGIAFIQGLGSALIIYSTKRYFMHHVEPRRTMLIYGSEVEVETVQAFKDRLLKKYKHLFRIDNIVSEDDFEKSDIDSNEEFQNTDIFIMYEVCSEKRSKYMKLFIEKRKNFYFTPKIEDFLLQGSSYKQLLDTPIMKYDYSYERSGWSGMKRVMDVALAVIMLVLFSPIFLITAIAIKLEDRGPVFYRQERCTIDEKVFRIIKFRSMVVDAEAHGVKPCIGRDPRVTRVGSIIRKSRIDELPQLFNIIKGDMSFVGPRPERVEHVRQYTEAMPEFKYRTRVKAGLTGYAQIYGKYNTSSYDKLRLDLMYIETQSLLVDLKILILTFRTMFQAESTEGFEEDRSQEINMMALEHQISRN